jgi:hypothetical protein
MNRSGNECYVALHHICLNEVIFNQFLPDDFELSLQLLDVLFAILRVEIPVALCEFQLEEFITPIPRPKKHKNTDKCRIHEEGKNYTRSTATDFENVLRRLSQRRRGLDLSLSKSRLILVAHKAYLCWPCSERLRILNMRQFDNSSVRGSKPPKPEAVAWVDQKLSILTDGRVSTRIGRLQGSQRLQR